MPQVLKLNKVCSRFTLKSRGFELVLFLFRKSGVDRQYAQDKLRELGDGAAEVIVGRGGTVLVCGSVRERPLDCFSKKKYPT